MHQLRPCLALALLVLVTFASAVQPLAATPLRQTTAFTAPTQITVTMYQVTEDQQSMNTGIVCRPGSVRLGCTAIPDEAQYGYPYVTNPITIDIERDYLPDVVPQESNPSELHRAAIEAQAVAARSYAYYYIFQNGRSATPIKEIENSAGFQVFLPYKFEVAGGRPFNSPANPAQPCASGRTDPLAALTGPQKLVCDALARRHYLSFANSTEPLQTLFNKDIADQTLPYGDVAGVADPISSSGTSGCNGRNEGAGVGMSQLGASRWARGNRCARGNPNDPWSVRWFQRNQILAHYYNGATQGVQVRDSATRQPVAPAGRWNPLAVRWNDLDPNDPVMQIGESYPVQLRVQNTSTFDWTCATGGPSYALGYRWSRAGGAPRVNLTNRVSLCGLARGADRTVTITVDDVPADWGPGQYALTFDVYTGTGAAAVGMSQGGWPTLTKGVRVCVGSGCERQPRKQDLTFVIDTTGSMRNDISAIHFSIGQIVNAITGTGDDYRVAIVAFRDVPQAPYGEPGDFLARTILDFSSDPNAIAGGFNSLGAAGGGDWPETVYAGLIHATELSWRADAEKAIILLGDAPPHDPEPVTGYTAADVVTATQAIGAVMSGASFVNTLSASAGTRPIQIQSILIADDSDAQLAFEQLATETSGRLLVAPTANTVPNMLVTAINAVAAAPAADPAGPYLGRVGQPLTLDGRASVDPDSAIQVYEWDVDGDGVFDLSTAEPLLSVTYAAELTSTVTLRVTDEDGHMATAATPVTITRQAELSGGFGHTCGTATQGTVACWGSNVFGQATPPSGVFSQVTSGDSHSCAIAASSEVVCWGNNGDGQATPPSSRFQQVDAGEYHTCGITDEGRLACWGRNTYGQTNAPGGIFTTLSVGPYHGCARALDGVLTCWGRNDYAQATPPNDRFVQVTVGGLHTCGVRVDGNVRCWGRNTQQQASPPVGTFTEVSAGFQHTCGLRTAGSITCWGANEHGQATPPSGTFITVNAGMYHTCAVPTAGTLVCWGYNANGQASPPDGTF